jgi:hypothetical protein
MLESKKADVIENPPGNLTSQINKSPGLHVDLFPSTRVDFVQRAQAAHRQLTSVLEQHMNEGR